MKMLFKILSVNLISASICMNIMAQKKIEHDISKPALFGKYTIQIPENITKSSGAYWYIQFDSSESGLNHFTRKNTKRLVLSKGRIGQPRIVEITYIPTNDSTVNISNAYEKNIPTDSIKSFRFYCTPGLNKISIQNGNLTLKNPNIYQKDYSNYLKILDQHVKNNIDPVMKAFEKASEEKDSSKILFFQKEYATKTSTEYESKWVDYPYIQSHPNSPVSLYVLSLVYSNEHLDQSEAMLHALSPTIQQLPTAINIKNLIQSAKTNAIGKIATDFTLKDTTNNNISLSDYKGKYVLIDFWASWCAPCRAENPNVVKVYNQFKDKNFTIISISLDDSRKNWLNAVKNDKLDWAQLSELKGWDGHVSHDYAVTAIPTNFLIDPNGKIIARNLRGEELENTIQKYIQ